MMIEIEKGLIVETEKITALQKKNELITEVYTHHHKFAVNIPYATLSQMINAKTADKQKTQELLDSFLKNVGTFSG